MPIPVDEAGNIVLPFDVMPGALDVLDAPETPDGMIVIEPDAEGEYPGPFMCDTRGQVRRRSDTAAGPAPAGGHEPNASSSGRAVEPRYSSNGPTDPSDEPTRPTSPHGQSERANRRAATDEEAPGADR